MPQRHHPLFPPPAVRPASHPQRPISTASALRPRRCKALHVKSPQPSPDHKLSQTVESSSRQTRGGAAPGKFHIEL